MKTKIKTISAICIVGFTGLLSSNAVANSKSANVSSEEGFPFSSNETRIENFNSNLGFSFSGETANYNLEKEAQLFTKWVVDQEEAKLMNKLNAKSEELVEAEAYTSWIVDQAEAKLLEKVMKSIETAEVK